MHHTDVRYKTKSNIITAAEQLIKVKGINDITISDVAEEMHLNSETIYEIFADKAQLLEGLIKHQLDQKKQSLQQVRLNSRNSIEQVFLGWNAVSNFFKSFNKEILGHLQKYYSHAFLLVEEFKNVFLYNHFKLNMDTGITEELYRHNIRAGLLSRYTIEFLQVSQIPNLVQKNAYGPVQAEDQLMTYHLYGMATEKGIKLIRKYKNEFLVYTGPYQ